MPRSPQTLDAIRRLAERPGTPEEGEAARAMLEKLLQVELESACAAPPSAPAFDPTKFPFGTRIFYNRSTYRVNAEGTIASHYAEDLYAGEFWMRIKFDDLRSVRTAPVYGPEGCHLSLAPLDEYEAAELHGMNW